MITEREKKLWDLLDDIDSAFDAMRPEMLAFEELVSRIVEKRHGILVSDGYELFEPGTELREDPPEIAPPYSGPGALEKKDVEIERLKAEIRDRCVTDRDKEENLKSLITRAADALVTYDPDVCNLIDELRKAAE